MRVLRWFRRLQAAWSKRLERPLRSDAASNERRLARLGDRRVDRLLVWGVVATVAISVAVPATELAGPGRWRAVWWIVTGVATVVLAVVFTILFRAGR